MYNYETEKPKIFTEGNQVRFLKARDKAKELLSKAGAFRVERLMGIGADSWMDLAFVDRMVELGEIREIPQENCAGQHRIFVNKTLLG